MSALNPLREDVHYFVLQGQRCPGRAVLKTTSAGLKWDEQAPAGSTGATLTGGGSKLAVVTFAIELWRSLHFIEWSSWRRLLAKPTPAPAGQFGAKKVSAMVISSPQLDELGVRSVVFESRTELHEVGEHGMWGCEVTFREYRAPKPLLVAPAGAVTSVDEEKSTPSVWENARIEALLKQTAALEADLRAAVRGE